MRSPLCFEGTVVIAAIFDVGGVLIDWNPRHLYRRLFEGDDPAMERFLAEVCTPAWNHRQDAGRSWAEGTAELVARWPEHAALIRAFDARWEEMVPEPSPDFSSADFRAAAAASASCASNRSKSEWHRLIIAQN